MNENSEKRIAIFLPSLDGGGAERVMVNLARGFVERGLKVDLVMARAEGPYVAEVHKDVRMINLGAKRVIYSLPGLVHYLRQERPTVMLSTLSHANLIALWARWIAGVPIRLVIREAVNVGASAANVPKLREKLMPFLMRLFYPWADGIIVNSHGVAEDLIKHIGISAEKVRVIYNPVVTPELFTRAEETLDHPWFAPNEPPVILGVGRLNKQKDFTTLIKALALVRREHPTRLIILGEGEERPNLDALVAELGLEADVALPGFVENPFKYMKRAALFVLSSRWEGLPNALIQAWALGTHVISTDCPSGPSEILESGKWGKLVPVADVEALAAAITAALNEADVPDMPANVQRFSLYPILQEYLTALGIDA